MRAEHCVNQITDYLRRQLTRDFGYETYFATIEATHSELQLHADERASADKMRLGMIPRQPVAAGG
jgi:hypothetical protein